jgi:ABC-type glucose/galactose transport system permease subunit
VATLTARAPATIGLALASDVAPRPDVALAEEVAVGVVASTITFGTPLKVGEPSTNAFVVTSTMFTEMATPVAAPPPLTGLASAVALAVCFEPAWIF